MLSSNSPTLTELDLSNSSTLTIDQACALAKALETNTVRSGARACVRACLCALI